MPYSQQYTHTGKCSAFPYAIYFKSKHGEVQRDYGNTGKHHGKAKDSGFESTSFHSCAACESSIRIKGRRIKVINTHGTQVVDCWALSPDNLDR